MMNNIIITLPPQGMKFKSCMLTVKMVVVRGGVSQSVCGSAQAVRFHDPSMDYVFRSIYYNSINELAASVYLCTTSSQVL